MLISVGVLEIAQTIKSKQMKKSFLYVMTLGLVFGFGSIQAQYDDVYYGSSSSRSRTKPVSNSNYSSNEQDEPYQDEYYDDEYDDESYNYMDEYDYNYTHRIRRFHRPLAGRSFYDPFYWDPWYFDPYYYSRGFGFITPRLGISFYSFNDYNRWSRWQRFNSFRYWDPWTYSYWSYDPFLFNRYNNYYWASSAWCPTSWYTNRYYSHNTYWGNSYNGSYQPRYYTDNNVHFGPRHYGATTTSDRGPSRSTTRVFSEPTGKVGNDPLRRTSPRDVETTVVRERNVPINRNNTGTEPNGTTDRVSPRGLNNGQNETSRAKPEKAERPVFRDYNDNNRTDPGSNQRNSPRINDNSNQERSRTQESPRRNDNISSPRNDAPSSPSPSVSPRKNNDFESRRMEVSPRNNEQWQQPRESPRSVSPQFEAPRQASPRRNNDGASQFRSNDNNSFRSIDKGRSNDNFSGSSNSRSFSSPSSGNNNSHSGSSGASQPSSPRSSPRNN